MNFSENLSHKYAVNMGMGFTGREQPAPGDPSAPAGGAREWRLSKTGGKGADWTDERVEAYAAERERQVRGKFCEVHQPDDLDTCPACEAVHQADLVVQLRQERDRQERDLCEARADRNNWHDLWAKTLHNAAKDKELCAIHNQSKLFCVTCVEGMEREAVEAKIKTLALDRSNRGQSQKSKR